jgi:hypothetical protein
MPANSRRIYATHEARLTKTIEAPLKYVYDWCTDYRTDDGKFSKSKPRFQVLRPSKDRVVRLRTSGTRKSPVLALELIRLNPPNGWHVDQIDESDLETTDYRLTRVGPRRTRITLDIVERWTTAKHPTRSEWVEGSGRYWDRLVAALETRHRSGRPAKG